METVIDFIRHGEPEGGRRFRGHSIDDVLSEKGWTQMRRVVESGCPWTQIVSSPLVRCHAFADELNQQHHVPVRIDDRLKEVGFGSWEGLTHDEIQARELSDYQAFYRDPVSNRPPGAEPLDVFFARVSSALKTIVADFSGQHVLVVAHAGVIRAIMAHVLDIPAMAVYRIQVVNAGLSRVRYESDCFQLVFLNRKSV
ncbi:MAG: alpha-ribazole phosphatase family protein [Gammaproteobacteria bacterium]|nr:alpha-ribazole phosphatase family protein [Gammaproteobacteria bacterium]